jgi:hypothetical protein
MLYVERSSEGKIVALYDTPRENANEKVSVLDKEVISFISSSESWNRLMSLTDTGAVRILEDLIDLLVRKNLIQFTELPEHAQKRIWERKRIREKISADSLIVDDII